MMSTNDGIVKRSVLSYDAGFFLDRLKQQAISKHIFKSSEILLNFVLLSYSNYSLCPQSLRRNRTQEIGKN